MLAQVFPLTGTFWPAPALLTLAPEVGAGIIFNPLPLGPCCLVVFSCATSCIHSTYFLPLAPSGKPVSFGKEKKS